MILGSYCTRNCGFCAIKTRKHPGPPDREELFKIRDAVDKLGIRHVIVTSVTRDDLHDGGAGHFADCIKILRDFDHGLNIEVLVPDFFGNVKLIDKVLFASPDIFSHNIETVPRLYEKVRPGADYKRSLRVIEYAKSINRNIVTKSGLMAGLGETRDEVHEAMRDLKKARCDIVTIGQYLRPGPDCLEVEELLKPAEFDRFSEWAEELGFKGFLCSPLTRSSSFTF